MYITKELGIILYNKGCREGWKLISGDTWCFMSNEQVLDWIFKDVDNTCTCPSRFLKYWYTTLVEQDFTLIGECVSRIEGWFENNGIIDIVITHESTGSDEWVYLYEICYLPKEHLNKKRRIPHFKYIKSHDNMYDIDGYETKKQTKHEAILECFKILNKHG